MQEKKRKKCGRRIISGKMDEAAELKFLVGDVIEGKSEGDGGGAAFGVGSDPEFKFRIVRVETV